jgi:hypothetical protein
MQERRMRYLRPLVLLALGTAVSVCARRSTPGDVTRTASDATVITRAEMDNARYASLYEVVQALRGRWLLTRGPNTIMGRTGEVQVFVDDMRMGGVDALRSMKTDNVVSITFVDPVTAGQRWGGKFAQGTIVVATHADTLPQH